MKNIRTENSQFFFLLNLINILETTLSLFLINDSSDTSYLKKDSILLHNQYKNTSTDPIEQSDTRASEN